MMLGEKIRLYPTKEQEKIFLQFAGTARFAYNVSLAYKIERYESEGYSCKVQDMIKHLQELKYSGDYDWLKEVPEAITKRAIKDLDKAYIQFYKRGNIGYPKYKKKGKCQVSFYQRMDRFYMVDSCHVKITGIKEPVKIREHEDIKNCQNPRVTYDGKYWYFSYSYEVQELPKSESKEIVGVDLGVKNLVVTSKGDVYENINKTKKVKQLEKRLCRLQRKVSRKYEKNREGSRYVKTENIKKLEQQIRLVYRKLRNIRNSYIHGVTSTLVKAKPGYIVIEDLNVRGMMKNRHLSKAIQEQEFNKFRQYLTYKCQYYGVGLIVADRYYASTKLCSCCGRKKKCIMLSERVYVCEGCGSVMDRDMNAARNLERYGKEELNKISWII